jgi:hypothetical protein
MTSVFSYLLVQGKQPASPISGDNMRDTHCTIIVISREQLFSRSTLVRMITPNDQ